MAKSYPGTDANKKQPRKYFQNVGNATHLVERLKDHRLKLFGRIKRGKKNYFVNMFFSHFLCTN